MSAGSVGGAPYLDAPYLDGPGAVPGDADAVYLATIERLLARSRSGTRLGLERIAQVLADLDHPETACRAVHVAGSNGKGSTCAFLASILSAADRTVGLYTSPHLSSLTERIQIVSDGGSYEVGRRAFVRAVEAVEAVAPNLTDLSFFEAVTAAGLLALRGMGADVNVIEAGLGARLDATRLVDAEVAVLTDLTLEHTEFLGDTIEEIAYEEGAVMRPGRPLVCADAPRGANRVIDEMAQASGVRVLRIGEAIRYALSRESPGSPAERRWRFELSDRTLDGVALSLLGRHQARNALLAAEAAIQFDPSLSDEVLREGLRSAKWPGRMELFLANGVRPAPVLLDGAHNAQGAEVLARALDDDQAVFPRPIHLVFAVMSDKDVQAMLQSLLPFASSLILTAVPSPRCSDPADVLLRVRGARAVDAASAPLLAEVIRSPDEALSLAVRRAAADGGTVVVAGSLYLIGAVRPGLVASSS